MITSSPLRSVAMVLLVVLGLSSSVHAVTHTISFGGEYGHSYIPNNLLLNQGDVLVFEGDFAAHPLRFDEVPEGQELPEPVTSGTQFSYAVMAGGFYHFSSDKPGFQGMVAVIPEQVSVEREPDTKQLAVYPNPVTDKLTVELGFPYSEVTSVELYDDRGVASSLLCVSDGATAMTASFDPGVFASGIYFLYVHTRERTYQRKIVIGRTRQ